MADFDEDQNVQNTQNQSKRAKFSISNGISNQNYRPSHIVDLPEDILLCILSFLFLREISSFASSCKHFHSLCRDNPNLWFGLCDRRWADKTEIKKWGDGKITFKCLYVTLMEWEKLIGLWRRAGWSSPLILFEWGPSYITASRIRLSNAGECRIVKIPFLFMGLSSRGNPVNFVETGARLDNVQLSDFIKAAESGFLDSQLIPVNVSFIRANNILIANNQNYLKVIEGSSALLTQAYRYFTYPRRDSSSPGKKGKNQPYWNREDDEYVKFVNSSEKSCVRKHGLAFNISKRYILRSLLKNASFQNP
ncbi:F-box protein At3g12350-like [Aristolochia californica]|uniref:F-box protein At3g12350-like n=1 Tax=Aristolochia californica TaxID=171875 RepID=UPI0035D728B3